MRLRLCLLAAVAHAQKDEARAGKVYAAVKAKDEFRNVLCADAGHAYAGELRAEMLAWFAEHLRPGEKGK